MSYSNAFIEIQLGNVESRLIGPVPRLGLDNALNPNLRFRGGDEAREAGAGPLVFNPVRDTFLTGALPAVKKALRAEGAKCRIRDFRSAARPTGAWKVRSAVLRDYQEEVVAAALRAGRGLIDIGTGGGKTLLAAAIVARLGLPTLWLVTTRVLLEQTRRAIKEHLGVEPGVIGAGVRQPERLTVALIQSLEAEGVDLEMWRSGTLVFDEGHHAAAGTYQDLIRRLEPRYQFFLSAVPFRAGSDQAILDALAGHPLTGGKYSARFLIENGYACPVEVRIEQCRISGQMAEKPFATLYREFIVENTERNERVAAVAGEEIGRGGSVLILTERIEHGELLKRAIGPRSDFAHGEVTGRKLQGLTEDFSRGRLKCLIATSGLFQEGVNISGIHVLIAAGGLKSRAKVIQTIGRGMRLARGKKSCLYVDFWDDDVAGVFRSHSRQRLRILKEMGFNVPAMTDGHPPESGAAEIPAQWTHAPDSKRFLKIDSEGRIVGQADCYRPALVPERFCKVCDKRFLCRK